MKPPPINSLFPGSSSLFQTGYIQNGCGNTEVTVQLQSPGRPLDTAVVAYDFPSV